MKTDSMTWTPTQRWVRALTGAASLLVVLDSLVVSTALSAIRLDLAASDEPGEPFHFIPEPAEFRHQGVRDLG